MYVPFGSIAYYSLSIGSLNSSFYAFFAGVCRQICQGVITNSSLHQRMGLPAWTFKSYSRFAGLKGVGCLTVSFKNEFGWLQIISGLDCFGQLNESKTSQVKPTSNL